MRNIIFVVSLSYDLGKNFVRINPFYIRILCPQCTSFLKREITLPINSREDLSLLSPSYIHGHVSESRIRTVPPKGVNIYPNRQRRMIGILSSDSTSSQPPVSPSVDRHVSCRTHLNLCHCFSRHPTLPPPKKFTL